MSESQGTSWRTVLGRGVLVGLCACLVGASVSPMLSDSEIRARVAATRSRLRSIATGIEAYMVDWRLAPYDGYNYSHASAGQDRYEYWQLPRDLTTPISYCDPRQWADPFRVVLPNVSHWQSNQVRYICTVSTWGAAYDQLQTSSGISTYLDAVELEFGAWRLNASGPDRTYGPASPGWPGVSNYSGNPIPYDPTNGANSLGDLVRAERAPNGYLNIPNP